MKTDLFTFSIQEAETLGIECAIVLAATKDLKNPSVIPNEMVVLIKDQIYGYKYGLKHFYYANTPDGDGDTEKGMNCESGACAI